MTFKDHFSGHAADYAAYRPGYPAALFTWLATVAPARRLAWDCGTGNGQAALQAVEHFESVVATDPSAEQLANAAPHPRVAYRVASAEDSGLESGSVDLITVAQALHWFDFDRFYAEAGRVLVPGGVLAAWTYTLPRVSPEIDPLVDRLGFEIAGPYWPPERRWVDEEYRTIPFPLAEIAAPRFETEERRSFDRFWGYLGTWSAVRRYAKETGRDPRDEIRDDLTAAWGPPETEREVRWPVHLRVGRS